MSVYNGWANYETWRINLEVVDGMTPEDFGLVISENFNAPELEDERDEATDTLANTLEEWVHDTVLGEVPEGLARDLALNFLQRVDYHEIAEHLIADYTS